MTRANILPPDPKLDLTFTRVVDVTPEQIWRAWTTPKDLMPWFCPKPWQTTECKIDLRPGGLFYTVMRGPKGEEFKNNGSYLEVIPNERLIWTGLMGPGFRPQPRGKSSDPASEFPFTAVIELAPSGTGTKYSAMVIHGDEEARRTHEKMGFEEGWGKALDQLVEYVKKG
jgi:uncharacterized protein YndB with AHSA1/START domain